MKQADIKALSIDELKEAIAKEETGIGKLKFAHAISPIENPMQIRTQRRLIARLKTELTAKQSAK